MLLCATTQETINVWDERTIVEIDTSCSYVPFGYVRMEKVRLTSQQLPDAFWASRLATDNTIESFSTNIEVTNLSQLNDVFDVIREDLIRVGKAKEIDLPNKIDECFDVYGCHACCGRVLLIRSDQDAFYLHWHRES